MKSKVYTFIIILSLLNLFFDEKIILDGEIKENYDRANAYLGDGETDALFEELSSKADNSIFLDNNYSTYYFSNLRRNFSNNSYGSCGFVSIGMLLSFYDTYWNDNIISNNYDVCSTFTDNIQVGADFCLIPTNTESPGISFEPSNLFSGCTYDKYLNIAEENKEKYFQFELYELAKKCFDGSGFNIEKNGLGLSHSEITELLSYYLYDYMGFDRKILVKSNSSSNQPNLKEEVVNKIKGGIPVILLVQNPNNLGVHSVIAYDYDSKEDEIYVHTGWRDVEKDIALTHVSLSDLGYSSVLSTIYLDVFMEMKLGMKYVSNKGDTYSASSFIFPREIELVSGNYADLNPIYSWKSLYLEKWVEDDLSFNLCILDSNKKEIFQIKYIKEKSYTLTDEEWDQVRFADSNKNYYVFITLFSKNGDSYYDEYWCRKQFIKPTEYKNLPHISPKEYGFADAYPTDSNTKENFISHSINGLEFETRRYRVGYIHNEDIVMSPIKKGINEAFIEYRFGTALNRMDVELSHRREEANEWLTKSNGTTVIEQFILNKRVTVFDLLSDETNLSRNRKSKKMYKIEFSQPAYRIRFYSKYNGTNTTESNKGRICIGNMAFYKSEYSLPLSGAEIDYDAGKWSAYPNYYNCYAYALNTQKHGRFDPGDSNSSNVFDKAKLCRKYIEEKVKVDAKNYNFTFNSVVKNQKCSDGSYKIALAIDPGEDYHWYRQNSDGTWSHKLGKEAVFYRDGDFKLIYDPEECNREYVSHDYIIFCGFYEVNVSKMV